jgi:antirestriction protein ArdC
VSDTTPNESFLQRHSHDVVERLIRLMEEGTSPFVKPWDARVDLGLPMNPTTGKSYRGGNLLHLWALQSAWDSQDNHWMSFKQAAALGAPVRKGEKAGVIEYWDWSPAIPAMQIPRAGCAVTWKNATYGLSITPTEARG